MNRRHVLTAAVVVILAGASALQAQTPAQTFAATCAVCHGPAGTPNPAMVRSMGAMPDFATVTAPVDSVWVRAITSGKGRMPAYATRLNAGQIRALVNYIKHLNK